MNVEKVLGKMTAKGLVITGGAMGGGVTLSPSDVAAALAGTSEVAGLIIRTLYLDDHRDDQWLLALVAAEAKRLAKVRADRRIHDTAANGLAFAAVFELVNPKRCGACVGRGEQVRLGVVCGTCEGRGTVRYSHHELAALSGMPRQTVSFNSDVFGWVGEFLSIQLCEALSHIAQQLADVPQAA